MEEITRDLHPIRLNLPEVIELMKTHLRCAEDRAHDLLERAIFDGSLQDIETLYPNGMEIETDITDWRDICWDDGTVMIEPSWAGSPAVLLPVYPLFSLEEICTQFKIGPEKGRAQKRPPGRPPSYDWDAFWIEVIRQTRDEGLPATQAELVDIMQNWFFDRGKEYIDQRTIEKKIALLFNALNED